MGDLERIENSDWLKLKIAEKQRDALLSACKALLELNLPEEASNIIFEAKEKYERAHAEETMEALRDIDLEKRK